MRSHSIFQEQKLIVLAPLAFYNYNDVKTEPIAEEIKPAETLSYEKSARKDSQTSAKAKSHLVKQEQLNKFAAKPQIIYATHKGAKRNLPTFFGVSPSIIPLQQSVASKLTLQKKDPQSFLHFTQPSPLSFNESQNTLNNQTTQNKNSMQKAKVAWNVKWMPFAQKQGGGREKLCIRRKAANEALHMPFFTELVELQKREITKPTVQVVLAFTSFEKKDLDWAFHLFQSYLMNLTNRLVAYNCFEKSVPLYLKDVNQNCSKKAPKLPFANSKARDLNLDKKSFQTKVSGPQPAGISGQTYSKLNSARDAYLREDERCKIRVKQGAQLLYGVTSNVRKAESRLRQNKHLIERLTAVAGIARTVRALNEPLRATAIPLSTQLYTVIRSPHVFKKTREQFATTQYKRVIKLSFRSDVAIRLFFDSFLLLKLPVEAKLVIKDL